MIDLDDKAVRAINNARALLSAMVEGGWQQICVTGEEGDIFLTRVAGAANPLLAPVPAAPAQVAPAAVAGEPVGAPHVGTVDFLTPVGALVAAGDCVARLEVLGEIVEVLAATGGRIGSHAAQHRDLAEYGTVLLVMDAA